MVTTYNELTPYYKKEFFMFSVEMDNIIYNHLKSIIIDNNSFIRLKEYKLGGG